MAEASLTKQDLGELPRKGKWEVFDLMRGSHRVAIFLSTLFNPLVYCTLFLGALAFWRSAWAWRLLVVWLGLVAGPATLLYWGHARGIWSDWDVSRREERRTYMPGVVGFAGVTAASAWGFQFPAVLRFSVLAIAIWLVLSTVVGFWWKISLHVGGTVGIAGLAALVWGLNRALVVAWVPVAVAWARLVLKRHTWDQVIAGAFAGAIALAIAWLSWGPTIGL
ncbi:MAG: hypothetical protein OWU33_15090 [Firmicutes bacterium]|nr:hypothetical protein [Bacillota bacterium]